MKIESIDVDVGSVRQNPEHFLKVRTTYTHLQSASIVATATSSSHKNDMGTKTCSMNMLFTCLFFYHANHSKNNVLVQMLGTSFWSAYKDSLKCAYGAIHLKYNVAG